MYQGLVHPEVTMAAHAPSQGSRCVFTCLVGAGGVIVQLAKHGNIPAGMCRCRSRSPAAMLLPSQGPLCAVFFSMQ